MGNDGITSNDREAYAAETSFGISLMAPDVNHWLTPGRLKAYPQITFVLFSGITLSILLRWAIGDPAARLPFTDFSVYWLALGTLTLGIDTLMAWLQGIATARAILEQTDIVLVMPTIFAFLRLSGVPVMAAYAGHAIIALIAVVAVRSLWRRNVSPPLKYAALITGTLLVSPYLLEYDLAWLALPITWLTYQCVKTGWFRFEREVLVAAWFAPLFCIALAKTFSVEYGGAILLALLWIIVRRSHEPGNRALAP